MSVLGYASQISTSDVIKLTNEKRQENGLPSLSYNEKLTDAAKAKGAYMLKYQFWAHVAPDGTQPWKFFLDSGYKYKYAGENLARDFPTAQSAVDAWMASPSHRDNMLSDRYSDIGVAVVEGTLNGVDTTIIVQLFGQPLSSSAPQIAAATTKTEAGATPTVAIQPSPLPSTSPQVIAQVSPLPSPTNESGNNVPIAGQSGVLFSPFTTTRLLSLSTILLLIIVMIVDGFVISRRKITRVGGRTFAHLAFLGMILAIVLIAKAGEIL